MNILTHFGYWGPYDQSVVKHALGAEIIQKAAISTGPLPAAGFGLFYPWSRRIGVLSHGETYKNRDGQHGTGDERLTPLGLQQVKKVATHVGNIALQASLKARCKTIPPDDKMNLPVGKASLPICTYSSEDPRCVNSASAFRKILQEVVADSGISAEPVVVLSGFNRLSLGDLDGRTDEQIAQRDPAFAKGIARWMAGELPHPPLLSAEHMGEDAVAFRDRVNASLQVVINQCEWISLLFATSSVYATVHARLSSGGVEEVGPDGLPNIPYVQAPRDMPRLYWLSDNGYTEPQDLEYNHRAGQAL